MKIFLNRLIDVFFLISLVLIGKFNLSSFELGKYQVVVVVFWVTGILKYMNLDNSIKETVYDFIEDFIIAILVIPLWLWISGDIVYEVYEPLTILVHLGFLLILILITKNSVKDCGSIAYYTHIAIPIITIVLIKCGIPIIYSMLVAVVFTEPINYYFYKNKEIKSS